MRRVLGLLSASLLLSFSSTAWGQQISVAPVPVDSDHQADQNYLRSSIQSYTADCSSLFEATRAAKGVVERDRKQLAAAAEPGGSTATSSVGPFPSDLRQDLMLLQQREAALNRCATESNRPEDGQIPGVGCSGEQLLNFQMNHEGELEREIPIMHLPGSTAFFFASGMTIDADGAPNAYHPDNTGLDDLANAGAPGYWEGLAKDGDGEPFVQGPNDPFPGYYVSATALSDRTRSVSDPLRYVDASKIPYIVLPGGMARQMGARPGDFAVVLNQRNARSSFAIFGDVGPFDRIGEGSVALAENLGIHSDARNGGARRGILYLIFPGSGNGRPRTVEEINSEGEKLLQVWGGSIQLEACSIEGIRNTN